MCDWFSYCRSSLSPSRSSHSSTSFFRCIQSLTFAALVLRLFFVLSTYIRIYIRLLEILNRNHGLLHILIPACVLHAGIEVNHCIRQLDKNSNRWL